MLDKAGSMMDDRIRISDADRERVTARLREHFAEGRLSGEELEERISAALSAKTFRDLRHLMADLPDPAPVPPTRQSPPWAVRRGPVFRRGPRILPLAVFVLIAALVIPGAGWLFLAFLKLILVLWLTACLAGIVAAAWLRRHLRRRYWRSSDGNYWHQYQWRG
jgi:Domain of unknown function (DUF1707)